ncbi:hypothetical protein GCM10025867_37880 [Frondihabitans sucicola]|uniref:Glycosyltransferase 2-like domain-containing protein n=2 Tax=Frondihabitans sucicola TaxID=1268041 RepID=A0ABM8GSU8_9MICO|nr:hypothetical protein GCM10025867_37880 [Frondihabitans sucicola]
MRQNRTRTPAPPTEENPIDTAPLVSVVIPARDVEPWIDELLASVLAQGGDELQVVVVDDHSTDGTGERLAEHARRDGRILHHVADTTGAAAARNTGVGLATGRYLVFADADDLVPRGAYAALVATLESSGSDFAIGDHLKFSPTSTWSPTARWYPFDTHVVGAKPVDLPSLVSGRAAWNRMFRRSFWDDHSLAFPEIARTDDILPMTRAFTLATAIDVVPDCVYLYRDRPGSTSMTAGTPPRSRPASTSSRSWPARAAWPRWATPASPSSTPDSFSTPTAGCTSAATSRSWRRVRRPTLRCSVRSRSS